MPKRYSRGAPLLATVAALLLTSHAAAQTTTFTVDRLFMAGAPGDGIGIWRPEIADRSRFFGQLGLGFTKNPFRVDNYVDNLDKADKIPGQPLSTQLITTLNVGAEIQGRVSLQLSMPFVLYQSGSPTNNAPAQLLQTAVDLQPTALGDLRIEARFLAFRTKSRAFKLALSAAAYLPTGNKYSFTGDNGPGGAFGFATEYDFKALFLVLNAAYRLRPTTRLNEVTVSNEVLYGVGAYVPLRKGTVRLGAEIFGAVGAGSGNVGDLDTTPLEWMLNGRMYFTPKRQVYAGLGFGSRLTGGYAPDFRTVAVVGASFGIQDTDPRSPDGRYVFETSALVDTDHDGIPDEVDACPKEPGELSSDPDKIGCPKYIRRAKGSNEIEILKRIEFAFDKSTILPNSLPTLDEIAALVKVNPDIQRMNIEGHTDNQGGADYNQHLSEDRARSVMRYLVGQGVDPALLVAKGYGMMMPLTSNDTDAGRQTNRRVEFHIVPPTDNRGVTVPQYWESGSPVAK